ncbi:hypothetical protein A9Q99_08580 [Gammaproteobacteria bacterium 45_16_T64]|nr:hypothetical protein A9Q99_08580 [Gammaproteobacteria bacterium 45_16_T64]
MSLDEICDNETLHNKAFESWINSKHQFPRLTPDNKEDLIAYVQGLNREIANLQTESTRLSLPCKPGVTPNE